MGALFRQSAFLAEDAFSADHTSHSEIPCKQRHMALPRPLGGRRAGGGRWPPVHAMGGWIPPIGPLGGGGARVCYPRSWKGRHRASSDRHFEGMPRHTNNTTRPSGAGRGMPLWAHYVPLFHTMCLCGHTYGHFRRRSHIATARGVHQSGSTWTSAALVRQETTPPCCYAPFSTPGGCMGLHAFKMPVGRCAVTPLS